MDPITHGILGATCAHLLFSKKNKDAWIAGGLAAMAPDLDVLIQSVSDPMTKLLYHRHFTHALISIPLGAAIVTFFLMLFKTFRTTWLVTFLAAFVGYATHGLLDAFTTYGTVLYWPFSDKRISWDIISIVDPYITFPLLLGLIWTMVNRNMRGVIVGLLLASISLSFHVFQHYRINKAVQAYAEQRHLQLSAFRTFPYFASSTQWHGLGISNQRIVSMDIYAFISSPVIEKIQYYPLFSPANLPDYVKNSPTLLRDYQIFHWFSDGYLVLVKKDPLTLADSRFLLGNPARPIWTIQFLPNHRYVKMITQTLSPALNP